MAHNLEPKLLFVAQRSGQSEESPWPEVFECLESGPDKCEVRIVGAHVSSSTFTHGVAGHDAVPFNFRSIFSGKRRSTSLESASSFGATSHYAEFRFRALKLLSRNDMTGTFRFVDREAVLAAAVLSAFEIVRPESVDLLVFPVTPHEFFPFVLLAVAEYSEIPVLFFQPASIAPVVHARNSITGMTMPLETDSEYFDVVEAARLKSREKLELLREGVDPAYMQRQRQRDREVSQFGRTWRVLRATVMWLFRERFPHSVDFSGHSNRQRLLLRGLGVMLTRSLQKGLRRRILSLGAATPPSEDFVVFALQYEPERTSMPEGLPFDFQGDAVITARAMVPSEISLLVKEHYSQQSAALRGFVGRSIQFYDLIETLPNTVFAPTADRLIDLVERAQCVFTLTGTIALEAALRGVPVGYFGTPWWAGLPGTTRIDRNTRFSDVVGQPTPTAEEVYTFFDNLVRSSMIPGLAGETVPTTEYRLGPLPERFASAEAAAVVVSIFSALRSTRTYRNHFSRPEDGQSQSTDPNVGYSAVEPRDY